MTSKYLIGIDFGTTFSGVAWAWSGQPDLINIVTSWPTSEAQTEDNEKAPSEIFFDATRQGSSSYANWGYDIDPGVEPFQWFKLLLADEKDLDEDVRNSEQLQAARRLLAKHKTDAVTVAAQYLKVLWNHAITVMKQEKGESAINTSPFRVVITVPAIWKPNAQSRTMEAAKRAGILAPRSCGKTVVTLVPEPEAAALATLADFKGRPDVKRDDVFVICDAGGGTVDIISYKVETTDPLVLRECVEGQGGLCGAIFLDEAFKHKLMAAVGRKRWEKIKSENIKRMIRTDWEHGIKRGFNDSDKKWNVMLPADVASSKLFSRSTKTQVVEWNRSDIRCIFEDVMSQIRELVFDQITQIKKKTGKPPKAVILVGGLGRCNYLYTNLQAQCRQDKIEILQSKGPRPWTAICRGAVVKASMGDDGGANATVRVDSRISRLNYGVSYHCSFVEGYHDPRDKKWSEIECTNMAENQMTWYLNRGDDVAEKNPVSIPYYQRFPLEATLPGGRFSITLLQNDAKNPARRRTPDVKTLCSINCTLGRDFSTLPTWHNPNGRAYRNLDYEISMTFTGAVLDFAVYVDGERLGQQNVQVQYEYI